MRMKKVILGIAIAIVVMAAGGTIYTADAKAATKKETIKVTKKSQLKKAKEKIWAAYESGTPFKIKYTRYIYKKKLDKYLDNQIKNTANVKWLPPKSYNCFSNAKKLADYKETVKYLSLICKDIREETEKRKNKLHAIYANPVSRSAVTIFTHDSEVEASELEDYIKPRCEYSSARKYKWKYSADVEDFRSLYEDKFRGVCWDGAEIARDIGFALGYKMYCVINRELDHGWAVMKVQTMKGEVYYSGIYATSFDLSIKKLSDASKIRRNNKHITSPSVSDPLYSQYSYYFSLGTASPYKYTHVYFPNKEEVDAWLTEAPNRLYIW